MGSVSGKRVPEEDLAVAVIQRAVSDLRDGVPARKRQARRDIADGLLDYWILVATGDFDAQGAIKAELERIAGLR